MALADACWHRLAPLSMGKLDRQGRDPVPVPRHRLQLRRALRRPCPPRRRSTPARRCRRIPVVERYRYMWVWLGDPPQADPRPDPGHAPDASIRRGPATARPSTCECNYQLVLDNLMDLTHEEFVHTSSIGGDEHQRVRVRRHPRRGRRDASPGGCSTSAAAVLVMKAHAQTSSRASRATSTAGRSSTTSAPSTICIDVGVAKAGTGAPEGDRSQGVNGYVMNTITPETDRTCHYFWAFMRNYRAGQPADHHPAARRRAQRLRRGRGDAAGAAGGDRRQPRLRVLQPQHRRRRHVGPPDPRADARGRGSPPGPPADDGRDEKPWQRPTAKSGSAGRVVAATTVARRHPADRASRRRSPAKADARPPHRRRWSVVDGQPDKRSYSVVDAEPDGR